MNVTLDSDILKAFNNQIGQLGPRHAWIKSYIPGLNSDREATGRHSVKPSTIDDS